MHSSPAPAGVPAGLANWRAGVDYQGVNASVFAYWLTPNTGAQATIADVSIKVPHVAGGAGGAFQLSIPDATAYGGNKRGSGAADLQVRRNAANKVASGDGSFQAGINNRTTGANAVSIGDSNDNVGPSCSLIGTNLISDTDSEYASAIGRFGSCRGITGQHVHSAAAIAVQADCQYERIIQGTRNFNGPYKVLVGGAGSASTKNLLTCPNNAAMQWYAQVVGTDAGLANIYCALWKGGLYRTGATIGFVGTPNLIGAADTLGAGPAGWTVTPTLDTTNFGFNFAMTTPGVFIQWSIVIHAVLAK